MSRPKSKKAPPTKAILRISLKTGLPICFFPEKVGAYQTGLGDRLPYMATYSRGQYSQASTDYLSDQTRPPISEDAQYIEAFKSELASLGYTLKYVTRLSAKMKTELYNEAQKVNFSGTQSTLEHFLEKVLDK